jgi:hypothetical protein
LPPSSRNGDDHDEHGDDQVAGRDVRQDEILAFGVRRQEAPE